MKLYFAEDGERCYPLSYHKERMHQERITELKLDLAKPANIPGVFYCNEFDEVGETSECCGTANCDSYAPRNGNNGLCKHWRKTYEPADETLILTLGFSTRKKKNVIRTK